MASIRHQLETICDKIAKVLTEHNISLLEIKSFFKAFDIDVNANRLLSPDDVLDCLDSSMLSVFNHFFHLPTSCLEHGEYIAYRHYGITSKHIKEPQYTWEELERKNQWFEKNRVQWNYAVLGTGHGVEVLIQACMLLFHDRVVLSAQPLVHSGPSQNMYYKELEEKILGNHTLLDLSDYKNDQQGFVDFIRDEAGYSQYCFVEFLSEDILRDLIDKMLGSQKEK